jgi:hypothetical protein
MVQTRKAGVFPSAYCKIACVKSALSSRKFLSRVTALRQGVRFADGLCAFQKAATTHQGGHAVQKRVRTVLLRLI